MPQECRSSLVQTFEPSSAHDCYCFHPVDQRDKLFTEAAVATFTDKLTPVWRVTDLSGGADQFADETREALLAGAALSDTSLGQFLKEQIARNASLCMFWASDFLDLPAPDSVETLFELLTEQLSSDGSWNWELYACWDSSHTKGGT